MNEIAVILKRRLGILSTNGLVLLLPNFMTCRHFSTLNCLELIHLLLTCYDNAWGYAYVMQFEDIQDRTDVRMQTHTNIHIYTYKDVLRTPYAFSTTCM